MVCPVSLKGKRQTISPSESCCLRQMGRQQEPDRSWVSDNFTEQQCAQSCLLPDFQHERRDLTVKPWIHFHFKRLSLMLIDTVPFKNLSPREDARCCHHFGRAEIQGRSQQQKFLILCSSSLPCPWH